MSDRSSLSVCSREGDSEMGRSIAIEAQRMVREAAEPVPAGETIKGQLRRAARALRYADGDWRIRAAWYGEAQSWSAAAFEELRARYGSWRERQEAKAQAERLTLAARYAAIAERLRGQDENFHRQDIDALVAMARRIGGENDGEVK